MTKAMESKSRKESILIKYAIFSRLLVLFLTLLWRSLLQPYDTSAALNPPCLNHKEDSSPFLVANAASRSLENSVVWDSVYFLRITECGYEYEQTYAFLPLLPFFISILSRTVFAPLVPFIGLRAVMVLSGYTVSNLAFVFAAIYLFRVSVIILKDTEASFRASIIFCFNPASIFYSSIYSESLYALFSIGGVYHLLSGTSNVAVLWFALSGYARSNGVLNAGYICFQTMHRAYEALYQKRRIYLTMQVLVAGLVRCLCICLPFVAFQAYGYYNICHGHTIDEMRPWCKGRIPLLYNFIQIHYWGVGFLKYFQFKQLPNFLLATPILSLAVCSIMSYMKSRPELFISLGFQATKKEKRSAAMLYSLKDVVEPSVKTSTNEGNRDIRQRKPSSKKDVTVTRVAAESSSPEKSGYFSADVFPFIVHLGLMATTAFFIMHVQVATRFLSASPPLYWFASYLIASPKHSKWGYLIWSYCAAYILLGTLLFSNFYPFT
ncbi:PREDICTED: GPI mannosyltransferase 2-like isoform X1 [Camelina sativa]|uniref:GPI mannosyltransferase 2 n=1 Tax=Camelina sativa TaxID=90675 RepID=A0ABM0VMX0_CAMSA|nr:PREDICTED: GPI mannosyltransferase 2-like isoform X1 [Camelina sativa]